LAPHPPIRRIIGNAAIPLRGSSLIMASLVAVSILFSAAFFIVMFRKLKPSNVLPDDFG